MSTSASAMRAKIAVVVMLGLGACATAPQAAAPAQTQAVDVPDAATAEPAAAPGLDASLPAPMNESISTAGWEFSVLEVLRGEPAMDELQGASAFNKPPEDAAMEYVLVRLRVKYVGASSEPKHVDRGFFESAGSDGTRYERPSILDVDTPAPVLQGDLTTGGSAEVWITLLALKDDPGLVLVIEPRDNGISMVAEHTRYVLIGS